MALYLIEYQVLWQTHVDLGRAIAQADSPEEATLAITSRFNLPQGRTTFKTELIEDGVMHLVKRSVTHETASARFAAAMEHDFRQPSVYFNCKALGVVKGQDEEHALKRLAHAVINKCNNQTGPHDKHVLRLMLDAELRTPGHEKPKAMELVETYKGKGIIRS